MHEYNLNLYIQDLNSIEGIFDCDELIIPVIHKYCQRHWPGPYQIILKDHLAYVKIDNSPDGMIWVLQNE